MDEEKEIKQEQPVESNQNVLPFQNVVVTKTISTTLKHIALVDEMAEFEHCSGAQIWREAVELLYAKKFPNSKV
jgi:hypothetical protein